jgi:uncharacterized protein YdgA (DUF945 family)
VVFDSSSERVKGHLYQTDAELSIDGLLIQGEDLPETTVKDMQFVIDSEDDGDFMSIATRLGSGRIAGGLVQAQGAEFTAMHFDFTVRRLHTDTLVSISNSMAESYQRPAVAALLPDEMLELLKHDPELLIDRIGFETRDGAAYLKGVIRLKGVNEKDLKMGALSLIARLDADLHFEAPQKVIESLDGGHGRDAMMGAVDGGYAQLEGDKVVSRVEFHGGELKINGKTQGIPGLGAPPSDEKAGPE